MLVMTLAPTLQRREPIAPEGYTVVTGDALPEWNAWRSFFNALADPTIPETVHVTPAERELIVTVAKRVTAAETDNRARQQRTLDEMTAAGKVWPQVKPILKAIDLEHRILTLRERDALLSRLAPKARIELERWVHEMRSGITAYVRTEDLEQYRLP